MVNFEVDYCLEKAIVFWFPFVEREVIDVATSYSEAVVEHRSRGVATVWGCCFSFIIGCVFGVFIIVSTFMFWVLIVVGKFILGLLCVVCVAGCGGPIFLMLLVRGTCRVMRLRRH